MGVYIKGMVMPTSCTNCERWGDCLEVAWFFSSEYDYDFEDLLESELNDRRHPNCPLVEVPEPHGRLIDADALIKASGVTIQITGDKNARVVAEALESIYQDIEDAQTVIEGSD